MIFTIFISLAWKVLPCVIVVLLERLAFQCQGVLCEFQRSYVVITYTNSAKLVHLYLSTKPTNMQFFSKAENNICAFVDQKVFPTKK